MPTDMRSFIKPQAAAKGAQAPRIVTDAPDASQMSAQAPTPLPEDIPDDVTLRRYMLYLKEQGINKDDILSVLGSILESGTVGWDFKLFDKIPVVLTLRPAWVSDYVMGEVDKLSGESGKALSVARVQFRVGMLNLAGSLVKYGEDTFNPSDEAGLEQVRKYLDKLPYVVQSALVRHLSTFDQVVAVATSDWAARNFTEPRKD